MKKKKILVRIFIIFIILVILAIAGFAGYNYYLEMNNRQVKENFYKYAFQNNFNDLFDSSFEKKILKRLKENSYESSTNVEFTNTFNNNFNLDIDKITLELNTISDKVNKKSDIKLNYSNNELFNLSVLSNSKYIGVKNDDILNNYMAVKRENISNIFFRINEDLDVFYNNIKQLKENYYIDENNSSIFSENSNDYVETFKKYITSKDYADEGIVILEQNGEKYETQIYSLTISRDEAINLVSVMSEKIIEDEHFLNSIISNQNIKEDNIPDLDSTISSNDIIVEQEQNEIHAFRESDSTNSSQNIEQQNFSTESIEDSMINAKISELSEKMNNGISEIKSYELLYNGIKYFYSISTGMKINESEENVKEDLNEIFGKLDELLKEKLDENSNVKIITYVANDKTLKTSILLGENIEIEIEYINEDAGNNSVKITLLENNENGYTINISKTKTNVIENENIEINFIENSELVKKIELKLNIEGSENSNKYNNTLSFVYIGKKDEGKFSSTITNNINFKNIELESLNNENCLLLDNLDDEDFNYTINKLNYRIENVYEEKMSKMNLINTNTSDTILQNNNQEETNTEENSEEKEDIINILIETISNKMGDAQNSGEEYTIQDLQNLSIDGYDVQVSVSQDLAIITINNYKFKIDKDFNLSE